MASKATSSKPEPAGDHPDHNLTIVGIGASAGGLGALRTMLGAMPPDPGLAIVIVMHLSPDHESHLANLLQPHCPLPVQQVTDTQAIERNRVYVIPPDANLSTIDTHLRLSQLEKERKNRAPIDHFFRTLADTHDGRAVGVVLTGTGTDGTLGIRRIKEQGGLTIAQDPDEAEHDGMPRSAIATGMVDRVLRLTEIPIELSRFAHTEPRVVIPEDGEDLEAEESRVLQKIFAQVRARSGHDFNQSKRSTMLRRIRRRMQLRSLETLTSYLDYMREHGEEAVELFNDLLITVTEFFRDHDVFTRIEEQIIPRLFDRKTSEDRLRVWSVGCSTGEEAYSLAILLLEEARKRDVHPQIQVFASDLHESALKRARDGIYPQEIATEVSKERLQRFFVKENGHYRVSREVRELVVFAPHNLLRDPPFSHLDLIVCRNLLIYLQRDVQQDVLALFHYALRSDGLLLLGTSETAGRPELFVTEDKDACVFRRRNVPTREPRLPLFPVATGPAGIERGEPRTPAAPPPRLGYGGLHELMVERYAPPSVLINEHHEIVHVSAHAGRFLQMPSGEPTNNIFKVVREPLQIELRAALHDARDQAGPTRSKPISVHIEGTRRLIVLRVQRATDNELSGFYLVIFDELGGSPTPDTEIEAETGRPAAFRELEEELTLNRQRLQAVLEEYESSREEMQASNEELQSANEELRSTMEELETSKEELQSMNEELTTLNQENRHRVEELSQLSSDLQNLLAATDIATLFLDRELRIIRFTPQVGELFNVRHTDRGRPLTDLTHRLGYLDLEADARRVLERLSPSEREVEGPNERWYLARILPYRGTGDRIEGIVITLLDITDRRRAEAQLRELNESLEQRVADRTKVAQDQAVDLRRMAIELSEAEQQERRRLARFLHDELQQLLVGARLQLANIRDLPVDQWPDRLAKVDAMLAECLNASRDLTSELSPPVLQEGSLPQVVEWLGDWFAEKHELRVNVQVHEEVPQVPEQIRDFLFQAMRELLLNAVKHSGSREAWVSIDFRRQNLTVEVCDGGINFDPKRVRGGMKRGGGFGLLHIRERLAALGGRLVVQRTEQGGACIRLIVPQK